MTKFDPKKPVQTRDGREAKIYETRQGGTISAFVQKHLHSEEWTFNVFNPNGTIWNAPRLQDFSCPDDLINIPPKKIKKEGWINIFKCRGLASSDLVMPYRNGSIWRTRKDAKSLINTSHYISTIKIEWEEEE